MSRRTNALDIKRATLRDNLWPGSGALIWDLNDRDRVKGFATLPRLMPLILHLIGMLGGGKKSGDPSSVYLELWCRDFGQGIVSIQNEKDCAYASGYGSNRAVRTWREHMFKLVELGFIMTKRDGLNEYSQVLLLNPLAVCVGLNQKGRVPEEWWTAFLRRAQEVGAPIPEPLMLPNPNLRIAAGM